MSYDVKKLVKLGALKEMGQRLKTDVDAAAALAASAFHSAKVEGNTVSLYTSADKSGDAAFTFDFPTEMFLDQTKTEFVGKFKWAEATYPGSTDPKLDGKPVMVLAVKGENPDSCTYSFLNMAALVDTYAAKTEGKDASTTVEISGYEVEVKVNLSKEANNALVLKDDGLFVSNANFLTAEERAKLAGIAEGATKVEKSDTNGNVKVNGVETTVYTEPGDVVHGEIASDAEVSEMLTEIFGK